MLLAWVLLGGTAVVSDDSRGAEYPAEVEVSELLDGNQGMVAPGIFSQDRVRSANAATDVNADGIDDFVIGAYRANPNGIEDAGQGYVIFGTPAMVPVLALSDLDGSNGFRINGANPGDGVGRWVNGLGDVNGDGRDDFILGASGVDPLGRTDAGAAYVVFGSSTGFPADLELSTLNGSNGFTIIGAESGDLLGRPVAWAGDLNADGLKDILIGAAAPVHEDEIPGDDPGTAYIVFGRASGFPAMLDVGGLAPDAGLVLKGLSDGDHLGFSLYGVGDFNGDGVDDFALGAPYRDGAGLEDSGVTYILFGRRSGFSEAIDLAHLDGRQGLQVIGAEVGGVSGRSVSPAGDFNGDGLDDVLIGAPFTSTGGEPFVGRGFVVFGDPQGYGGWLSLGDLDGVTGFRLDGVAAGDYAARTVATAGDVNRDGLDDIIIGARGSDVPWRSNAGRAYVVFGKQGVMPAVLPLDALDGDNGFALNGIDRGDHFGRQVGSPGDVDGDGFTDLFAVSADADFFGRPNAGEAYLLFAVREGDANFPPAIEAEDTHSIREHEPLVIPVSASDPGDAITLTADGLPGSAVFSDHGDGSGAFNWTPAFGDSEESPYSVTFKATDNVGHEVSETVTISVGPAGRFLQRGEVGGIVAIEAEHFHAITAPGGHAWGPVTRGSSYSGRAMVARPDIGVTLRRHETLTAPRLDYEIDFLSTGTHYVWVRGDARGMDSNSVYAGLDGELSRLSLVQPSIRVADWVLNPVTVDVDSAGPHILSLWMRDDGYRVDRIVLTTNRSYVPSGVGPGESPREPPS